MLEELLQDKGFGLSVHNAGSWGESCDQLITRFPFVIKDAASRGRVAAILVLAGTNDLVRGGVYCSELLAKLRSLHEMAHAAPGAPRVGVLTLPPANFGDPREKARIFVNEGLRKECQENPSLFLVDLESVPFDLSYDGLHYDADGYLQFAQRAYQAMEQFLHEF